MRFHGFGKKILLLLLVIGVTFGGCVASAECENNELSRILAEGVIRIGTTGDYYPMSYTDEQTNEYKGFDIDLSRDLATALGVEIEYVRTSWPTLMEDLESGLFDCAISGITINDARKERANMSEGYLCNGKTILCRTEDAEKFLSLEDVNRDSVTVMVNPGGTNQKFANEKLDRCRIVVYDINYEIPARVAAGDADVMITEIVEAAYYITHDEGLAAPLIEAPFTNSQLGILMPKESTSLLEKVNEFLKEEAESGRLAEIARANDIYEGCLR